MDFTLGFYVLALAVGLPLSILVVSLGMRLFGVEIDDLLFPGIYYLLTIFISGMGLVGLWLYTDTSSVFFYTAKIAVTAHFISAVLLPLVYVPAYGFYKRYIDTKLTDEEIKYWNQKMQATIDDMDEKLNSKNTSCPHKILQAAIDDMHSKTK